MTYYPRRAGSPAAEPLTLAEVRAHVKEQAGDSEIDAYLTGLIKVARAACEERTERTLIQTAWVLTLDGFEDAIELRHPPIIAVQAVKYLDTTGAQQTLPSTEYILDAASEPGRLMLAPGKTWPATQDRAGAVTIEYTAGYGATAAKVPDPLKQWMLLYIGDMHANRNQTAVGVTGQPLLFADRLVEPFRLLGV